MNLDVWLGPFEKRFIDEMNLMNESDPIGWIKIWKLVDDWIPSNELKVEI